MPASCALPSNVTLSVRTRSSKVAGSRLCGSRHTYAAAFDGVGTAYCQVDSPASVWTRSKGWTVSTLSSHACEPAAAPAKDVFAVAVGGGTKAVNERPSAATDSMRADV